MNGASPDFLDGILALTVRKGFWASPECEVFPHRLYARRLFPGPGRWGSSRNPLNVLNIAIGGYIYCLLRRPRVVLFGAAPRLSQWFAWLKRLRLLPDVRLVLQGSNKPRDVVG